MKTFDEWLNLREQAPMAPAASQPAAGQQATASNQAVAAKPLSDINAWMPPALQAQYIQEKDPGTQVGLFTTQLNNYLRHSGAQPSQNLMMGTPKQIGMPPNFEFEVTKKDTQEKRRFKPFDPNAIVEAGDWLSGKSQQQQ